MTDSGDHVAEDEHSQSNSRYRVCSNLRRGRDEIRKWLPLVTYKTFVTTAVISLVCMAGILAVPAFYDPMAGRETTVSGQVTYWGDSLVLHVVGLLTASLLISGSVSKAPHTWRRIAIGLVIPAALLFLSYALETRFLKPAFDYARPAVHLRYPWWEGWLRTHGIGDGSSCPSGFFLRQSLLLLVGIVYFFHPPAVDKDWKGRGIWSRIALLFLLVSTFVVAYSRVYRGFHTMFDIAVSVGVSCYLFWGVYYLVSILCWRVPNNMTCGITAATCVFVPVFLCYAHDAHWVILTGIFIFCAIGLASILGVREVEG